MLSIFRLVAISLAFLAIHRQAFAEDVVKIGIVLPLSSPLAINGQQLARGIKAFTALRGDKVAGKTIVLDIRDDAAVPDATKRLAQEMVVAGRANVLAGFGLTPLGAAAAPIATQAKVPMILMSAAGETLPQMSPYIARVFQTLPQPAYGMAKWAAENGVRKVVTLVADYAPGKEAEQAFRKTFEAGGGATVASLRVPLTAADFSAYLQRAKDAAPDAMFVFAPPGPAELIMKQFEERGMAAAGIKFIGAGDFVSEDTVAKGDPRFALGAMSAQTYSPWLTTPENQAFVKAYRDVNEGALPDIQSVSAFDGMDLIYRALEATKGNADGTALMDSIKGMTWNSPRGPVTIDASTRDITQNVYVRQFQLVDGKVKNVPIATFAAVKPSPE